MAGGWRMWSWGVTRGWGEELVLGFDLFCGLVVVLVGFAVGGGRCRVAVGRLGYGGWLGVLF